MRARIQAYITRLLLFFLAASNAIVPIQAADLDLQKQALAIIAEFGDKFCKTVPLHGETENLKFSAQSKAELSKLLKKIADLGFQGAAEYQKSRYIGVLQEDLATLLKDNMTCRSAVWKDLADRLLDPKKSLAEAGGKSTLPAETDANELKGTSRTQWSSGNQPFKGASKML